MRAFDLSHHSIKSHIIQKIMKKNRSNPTEKKGNKEQMLKEYSFKNGVRGKHYKTYRKGHTVRILKENGEVSVRNYKLEDGAVILDPDLRRYFPDSASVNNILRAIINLKPKKGKA